ncbi:cation diffusion facilitator family transporter [Salinicola avicenniae]|uniref:cation diffusion facilitator family transporter n=1 Tax=Salinicola avicenniae TaxID=2916836 RepID=UPI002073444E|nr:MULTISPECIES: cation diffusion facilitator family transporter [unclassified Salinicola]
MASHWPASESGALRLSTIMAALIGGVALAASALTGSQAILLDGLFNAIYAVVGLFALRIGRLVVAPDDDTYPFGYGYFESMVNACKGLLMLGVSALALFNSGAALFAGGNAIAAGSAIGYAVFATLACSLTAWVLRRVRHRLASPLVDADIDNWQINALISGAVLLAFCLIPLARVLGWNVIVPYIDACLVIAVVLLCLGVPIRMARGALLELLNRSPAPALVRPVKAAVESTLAPLSPQALYVRMVRPGRMLYVTVHVVVERGHPLSLSEADAWRARLDRAVRDVFAPVIVETLFTAEARWAVPSAGHGVAES